jgi:hypothetical protein
MGNETSKSNGSTKPTSIQTLHPPPPPPLSSQSSLLNTPEQLRSSFPFPSPSSYNESSNNSGSPGTNNYRKSPHHKTAKPKKSILQSNHRNNTTETAIPAAAAINIIRSSKSSLSSHSTTSTSSTTRRRRNNNYNPSNSNRRSSMNNSSSSFPSKTKNNYQINPTTTSSHVQVVLLRRKRKQQEELRRRNQNQETTVTTMATTINSKNKKNGEGKENTSRIKNQRNNVQKNIQGRKSLTQQQQEQNSNNQDSNKNTNTNTSMSKRNISNGHPMQIVNSSTSSTRSTSSNNRRLAYANNSSSVTERSLEFNPTQIGQELETQQSQQQQLQQPQSPPKEIRDWKRQEDEFAASALLVPTSSNNSHDHNDNDNHQQEEKKDDPTSIITISMPASLTQGQNHTMNKNDSIEDEEGSILTANNSINTGTYTNTSIRSWSTSNTSSPRPKSADFAAFKKAMKEDEVRHRIKRLTKSQRRNSKERIMRESLRKLKVGQDGTSMDGETATYSGEEELQQPQLLEQSQHGDNGEEEEKREITKDDIHSKVKRLYDAMMLEKTNLTSRFHSTITGAGGNNNDSKESQEQLPSEVGVTKSSIFPGKSSYSSSVSGFLEGNTKMADDDDSDVSSVSQY